MRDTVQELSRSVGIPYTENNQHQIRPVEHDHTTISRATAVDVPHGTLILAQKVPESHRYIQAPQLALMMVTGWIPLTLLLHGELPIRT